MPPLNTVFQRLFFEGSFQAKNSYTRGVMAQIYRCHTHHLGYHCFQCTNQDCLHTHIQYHSCGNRHCPFCGTMKKDAWVESRIDDLLPTPYYHMVFTVPHAWNRVMMQSPAELYKILFDAASQTLLNLAHNPAYLGATPGITTVLHTWGQKLDYHVHLHCVVSGGGIKEGKWVEAKRSNGRFLFPQSKLRLVYKATFLRLVRKRMQSIVGAGPQIEEAIKQSGYKKWKVYAKAPFGSPGQVIRYLGRYTHKTAISHHRIETIENDTVQFSYKDYADGCRQKSCPLSGQEFMRRFEQHILPLRFVRIRHYGFLTNRGKQQRLSGLRDSLGIPQPAQRVNVSVRVRLLEKYGRDVTKCPHCQTGRYGLLYTKRYGKIIYSRARDVPLPV